MKQTLRYDQLSCRLQVEGLPDVSIGQSGDAVGIITGWTLQWQGRPELEGRREHLLALMQVVLPYARDLISGVVRPRGTADQPVRIGPAPEGGGHRLALRSSQPETPPLELPLDDAELSDLVRLLDQLRLDSRLQMHLDLPTPQPLRAREVMGRVPRRQRLVAPLGGALALALAAGLGLLLPVPPPPEPPPAAPAASEPATP
ncbi:MAG: DUF4335 domain-containing protein [Cyanobacteria bacterium]|jgi:hypothetical protein|nr:DUF4335 domain-containing protein [Cyanobacteriota bacterium]